MPSDALTITVLLASPGDVNRERAAVRRAADEVNANTGEAEGFHLVVKGWETHSRPAAGRAQGNINHQIGPTDIFLGIMWARLGTPTGRAPSGTVEEYERARQRHKRSRARRKPSVMFYFKTKSPRSLRDLDLDQLAAVRAFKARVMKDNLAAEFETAPELERLVRRHLTAEAREIARSARGGQTAPSKRPSPPAPASPSPKAPSTPKRKPRKARKPTPRQFANAGFRSVRTRFERQAKAMTRTQSHTDVVVRRESDTSFLVTLSVHGRLYRRSRILVGTVDGRPSIEYHRGDTFQGYSSGPRFSYERRYQVTDRDGARGFELIDQALWTTPDRPLDQSAEVADDFWKRLTSGVM